jgi:dihydropteroate synthase
VGGHYAAADYGDDLVAEVLAWLRQSLALASAAGIAEAQIIIDPGIGFGKGLRQNIEVLRRLAEFRVLGRPLLLGSSRKSFIGRLLGGLPPEERVEGTAATVALGIAHGADIVRVHDVATMARVARVADAIVRGRLPQVID